MSVKITDLIEQGVIEHLKELDSELSKVLDTYTKVAKDLAKGLEISVSGIEDIDRLERLLVERGREAAQVQQQLTRVVSEQGQVVANTTNTISRQLMEQERVNKTQREAYTEHDRVKKLLEQYHDTYEGQLQSLVRINGELAANKKAQKDNEKALSMGRVTMAQYQAKQADLIAQHRSLTQEKRTLTQIMTAEEKAAQSQEGSYVHMSQQLELLKKAYKDLSEEGRSSDFGKELEASIQNLDAHLKDVAADMGEFQRNVGNYAIAGQNGVVATESVIAALNQEARTTQDLIDQTKILEEAKLMLNKEDANYQSTLDNINDKLQENKRKLSDVSDILDKEATTVAEAEAQNKRLAQAVRLVDLTSDDAEDQINKLNDKIAHNKEIIEQNTKSLRENTDAKDDNTKASEGLADELLSLVGINSNFGSSLQSLGNSSSGNFLDGMTTKVKAFGKTMLGLLANPWVLAFLGIAGVVAGFKWWYDYNKGLVEASKLTRDFTGLTGDAMKAARNEVQAVADMYDKDFREVLESANAMSKQFGISFQESMQLIEDGFVAGADVNGEFLENIKEYPAYFREAGLSASEFIAITTQANQVGIYSDKGIDVIKEGNLRIREMTKATAEALEGIGISSKQVQQDLAEGSKTTFDIMQQVSEKLAEFPESSSEVGTALADIFGGPGEDAGLQYILTLKDIDKNLDNVKDRAGELGELQEEQLRSQIELENTIAAVFDATGGSFESMTTKAKVFINDGIINIIKGCVDIVNWFIRMYNKSIVVRGAVNSIVNSFKTMWEIAKFVLNQVMDSFKALGNIIEDVVTMNWDKVAGHWADGMKALAGNAETMAKNIAANTADAFNNTLSDELHEVTIDLNANLKDVGNGPGSTTNDTGNKPQGISSSKGESGKDTEKGAKEELKRLHELEEAKIALMADGHEKELAMIRLKFKKKIDEIKGDGETENALRLQLAEQCQQEIAESDRKYQVELAKTNLENSLASVKEGSKEELDLKLAQLEATRAAELKAAEKTGADINLINAKFNKERLELEEEYRNNRENMILASVAKEEDAEHGKFAKEIIALNSKYQKEVAAAKGNADKLAKIEEKYLSDKENLEIEYEQRAIQRQIDAYKRLLEYVDLSADERARIEQKLAEAEMNLSNLVTQTIKKNSEEQIKSGGLISDGFIKEFQKWSDYALDILDGVTEMISTMYDAKIQKIEEEQEVNTAAGEAEQERITELVEKKVITEEEGEARKRAAEAKTAKKNEELEKKKQQLKHKQAVWDKANGVAQAGIATALAIMNALQTKPFPVGIAMAAIAGAMGAVQIATILATPIPKYAKGTDQHKGGPAIVGDGGVPELIIFGGKSWITPATPTLVDIPAGAVVVPNIDVVDGSTSKLLSVSGGQVGNSPVIVSNDYSALQQEVALVGKLIKQQTKQQRRTANEIALQQLILSKI